VTAYEVAHAVLLVGSAEACAAGRQLDSSALRKAAQ